MIIIANEIPITLLNPKYNISIQSVDEELLKRQNQLTSFTLYKCDIVTESEMKKRFDNLVFIKNDLRPASLECRDLIIIVIKTGDGYKFNQLNLNP